MNGLCLLKPLNATGWLLPPYIIFKGKNKQEGFFDKNVRIKGMWINTSNNGWIINSIAHDWLKNHFIPYINLWIKGRYHLLILDSYGSHLTAGFTAACSENNIIAVYMLVYSSYLCQPLDIIVFSPPKTAYEANIGERSRKGLHIVDKYDFLSGFGSARIKIFNNLQWI